MVKGCSRLSYNTPSTKYTVIKAASNKSGCVLSDFSNALAVPANPPRTDTGNCNCATVSWMASVACDKLTPWARLKLKVSEGTPASWDTDKAAPVITTCANARKGTACPWLLMTFKLSSEAGFCKYVAPNSSTTRYWLSGL